MTEFEFERGQILENLVLFEDHARSFPCPYCMEKHLSKIAGYAEEIAGGGEDVEEMLELAEKAREMRRQIQGAKEHSHNPRQYEPSAWTECELANPDVRRKIASCAKSIEKRQTCPPSAWGTRKDCVNPYAVCRASIRCPS